MGDNMDGSIADSGVLAALGKFWSVLAGLVAFVFGYGRLNAKVEAQTDRVDKMESQLTSTLRDIRDDVKEINRKVDTQKDAQQQMHIGLLQRLNEK